MAQRDLNKVILIGNIGRDPDLRQTENGSVISTFSLATNTTWMGRDGVRNERTEWHNIVAWNRLAEICHQIIHKGDQIYIEGRLRTRSWSDEKNERHHRTEVITEQMIKLSHHAGEDSVERTRAPQEVQQAEDNRQPLARLGKVDAGTKEKREHGREKKEEHAKARSGG